MTENFTSGNLISVSVFNETMARYKQARKYLQPFIDMMLERKVIDDHKIPRNGSAIVVANHRSDVDPFIVTASLNRYVAFLAADYDFKIPIFGNFLKELGMIPISAEKKDQINAFKEVSRVIRAGRLVGIFPEGDTYITDNDFSKRLGDFNAGFARFALKLKTNVLPVTILGVKEKVEPWPVPKFLREFLGMPPHIIDVKNRLAFKEVKVVIGDTIKIDDYLKMPVAEASDKLIAESRAQMVSAIEKHGEIERRKLKERQSGTRVIPN